MVQARATATHRSISRPGGAPHEAKRPQNFKVLSLSQTALHYRSKMAPKTLKLAKRVANRVAQLQGIETAPPNSPRNRQI